MILVLLQNGWSHWYRQIGLPGQEIESLGERIWDREAWLEATWACKSGITLRRLLAEVNPEEIWIDNTTLELTDRPSGILPIDQAHVDQLLARTPELVIACGKQAERAVVNWQGRLIVMPHPAYRLLNGRCIDEAARIIEEGSPRRSRIWPTKDLMFSISEIA